MNKEMMLVKLNEKIEDLIENDEDNYFIQAWKGHRDTLMAAVNYQDWIDDIAALAHSCQGRLEDGEEKDCEMEAELDICCQIMDWNEGK